MRRPFAFRIVSHSRSFFWDSSGVRASPAYLIDVYEHVLMIPVGPITSVVVPVAEVMRAPIRMIPEILMVRTTAKIPTAIKIPTTAKIPTTIKIVAIVKTAIKTPVEPSVSAHSRLCLLRQSDCCHGQRQKHT